MNKAETSAPPSMLKCHQILQAHGYIEHGRKWLYFP